MKQISNFMNEISDEFKIVVVEAIKALCLKYKQKHRTLMNFLSNMLRDEGGFYYKKAIVDTILVIISTLPEAKEAGLSHLCEFIEDCEFTHLSTKILNLLGKEGPTTSCPSKYIRYIYNRVILENANVRASAVSALARFGVALPSLRPRIAILLQRCLHDNDDEVRDRATFFLNILERDQELAQQLISDGLPVPLENLEYCLKEYQQNPADTPFSLASVPTTPIGPTPEEISAAAIKGGGKGRPSERPAAAMAAAAAPAESGYEETLSGIPQLASLQLGPLFRSTPPRELTESETEYVVNCVKHIFGRHIVFQFNCTNTLEDQLLEHVMVKMEPAAPDLFSCELELEAPSLPYQVPGVAYVCFSHQSAFPTGTDRKSVV